MAIGYNISVRKTAEEDWTYRKDAGESYSEATGERHEENFQGPLDELKAKAVAAVGAADATEAVTAEVRKVSANYGELRVTTELYRRPGAADDDDGGEDEPDDGSEGAELGSEEEPVYSGGQSTVPVSILCHPKFAELPERELRALKAMMDGQDEHSLLVDDEGNATGGKRIKDMITSEAGRKAMGYIRKHVYEWNEPHAEATARWKSRSNRYTVNDIVATVPGSVMKTPQGYNWRVANVGVEEQGGVTWQTATFVLSGPGGWDEYLYQGSGS